jgi:transposase-like protein
MDNRTRYSPEVQERAVRLVPEHAPEHPSQWAAIRSIAGKVGCTGEALRRWVRRAAGCSRAPRPDDHGAAALQRTRARGPLTPSCQREPAQGVGLFCPGGARPPRDLMVAFIDARREAYGVGPIRAVLPIARPALANPFPPKAPAPGLSSLGQVRHHCPPPPRSRETY